MTIQQLVVGDGSAVQRRGAAQGAIGARRRLNVVDLVFALLALVSVLPVLLVRYPQSVDYLNHIARLFVLTAPTDDPIHAFYRVDWHLMPNLALDLIGVPLALLLPVEVVMKLLWSAGILGTAAAIWFLHRSLYAQTQPTLVLGALALINLPVTVGLMNFSFGLAVALVAIGCWFRLGDRVSWRSILMLNLLGALTLVMHVAAFATLGLTIGILHVFRRPFGAAAMARRVAGIAASFALPLLLAIVTAVSQTAPSEPAQTAFIYYVLGWKVQLPIAPVLFSGNVWVNVAAAAMFWLALCTALRVGGCKCHPRLVGSVLLWIGVVCVLPFGIGTATLVDVREAIFPVMMLIAAIAMPLERRPWPALIAAIAIVGVLARSVILVSEWRIHDEHVQSFRAIDQSIVRGAKVLVASAPSVPGTLCQEPYIWAPFDEHIPVLAVIDRAAFVSTLFAMPDVQPIEPMPSVRDIAKQDAGIVPWQILNGASPESLQKIMPLSLAATWQRVYQADWRKNYDYLALRRVNCAEEIGAQPDLALVAESASYRLYRIIHTGD